MRVKNSILNFASSYAFYIIIGIVEFFKVRLFLQYLGEDIMSLHQLYLNVFSYLSIAEAGLGSGLIYRLYRLLINKEYSKINQIISGTQFMFRRVGIIIVGLGFATSFIMPFFIKDNPFNMLYLNITFMLFIIKNVIDYFMFVPRFIVQADQRMYKLNTTIYIFRLIEVCTEIGIICSGLNYIYVLLPSLLIRFLQNLCVNYKTTKLYSWFHITKEKDLSVRSDLKSLFVHRIANLVFNNIDIVLLSSFVGAAAVTAYSVYNYIVKYSNDTMAHLFHSMKDGLGNIINCERPDKVRIIMDEIETIFSYLAVIMVVVFYFVLNEFVTVWVGSQYVVDLLTLILFLLTVYSSIVIRTSTMFRTTMGLYRETQRMAIIEAIINLGLSLLLVRRLGIAGVLMGTVIARFSTNLWYLPYLVHKKLFGRYIPLQQIYHFKNILICIGLIAVLGQLRPKLLYLLPITSLWTWSLYALVVGVSVLTLVTGLFALFYKPFRPVLHKVKKGIISLFSLRSTGV